MSFTNLELVTFMQDTNQISNELANAIRGGDTTSITGNQGLTNAFVDLINKVIMVKVRGITTINRWKAFYKERIPFGSGIETVTIGQATDKMTANLAVEAQEGETYGAMEIKSKPEMTNKCRIGELSTKRYAVTVGENWIDYAVSNEYGISEVTSQFMRANEHAIEIDTDVEFFSFIKEAFEAGGPSVVHAAYGEHINFNIKDSETELAVNFLKGIHNLSDAMAYENTANYTDHVTRNLPKEDQILIIDTYIYSMIKRLTYAGAFNLSELRIPIDNIIVKDLGFKFGFTTGSFNEDNVIAFSNVSYIYAIIADRNHYSIHDKKYKTTVEYVASSDVTNVYQFIDRKFYETYGQPVSVVTATNTGK